MIVIAILAMPFCLYLSGATGQPRFAESQVRQNFMAAPYLVWNSIAVDVCSTSRGMLGMSDFLMTFWRNGAPNAREHNRKREREAGEEFAID